MRFFVGGKLRWKTLFSNTINVGRVFSGDNGRFISEIDGGGGGKL